MITSGNMGRKPLSEVLTNFGRQTEPGASAPEEP